MHADKIHIDASLVKQLLATQFPQWALLPITQVSSAGTDNTLYRLGNSMVIRLPRVARAVPSIEKEYTWLAKLAPHLPLSIPHVLAKGEPSELFPWPWLICKWIDGNNATENQTINMQQAAIDLGNFITAMHKINSTNGPPSPRGCPLQNRDEPTHDALKTLHGVIDVDRAIALWEETLTVPTWNNKPVWIHADLHPENILVAHGKIKAIIDFGMCGIGDPACDMMVAWTFLTSNTRSIFRNTLTIDDATWQRGRGWALTFGLVALAYYRKTNLTLSGIALRTIQKVLKNE